MENLEKFLGFKKDDMPEPIKVLTKEDVQINQFNQLSRLIEDSVNEIEKLAINKKWIKSRSTMSAQMKIYDDFLHHALKGDLSFANDVKKANRKARLRVLHLTVMVNELRSILENLIEQDIDVSYKISKWKKLIPSFKDIKKDDIDKIINEFK